MPDHILCPQLKGRIKDVGDGCVSDHNVEPSCDALDFFHDRNIVGLVRRDELDDVEAVGMGFRELL